MITVYGCGDDNLVLNNASYPYDEIGCYDTEVKVWFKDGTIIKCGYGKQGKGIWWIKVVEKGTAEQKLDICDDEDADIYSDIFEIDSEVDKYCRDDESEDTAELRNIFIGLKNKYPTQYIEQAYSEVFR